MLREVNVSALVLVHALSAVSFAVLGVVAFLQPRDGESLRMLLHVRWLGLFGLLQAALGFRELWFITSSSDPSPLAGIADLLACLPLFEFTRLDAASRLREGGTRWSSLVSAWIYLPLAAGASLVWSMSPAGAIGPRTIGLWLLAVPGALGGAALLVRGELVRSPAWHDRLLAVLLVGAVVGFAGATALDVMVSSTSPFRLQIEAVRALTALAGAVGLGVLVGRRTRETLRRQRADARRLTEVLGSLERRVDARTEELRGANEALATMRDALESSINACCIAGLDGRIRYANPALAALWELASPADAVDRQAVDFAASAEQFDEMARAVQETGRFDGVIDVRTATGRILRARAVTTLVRSPTGEAVGVMGSLLDVTDRLAAEAQLRTVESRHRQILDSLFGYVGVFDLDGTTLYANPAPLEVTGYRAEDIIGRRLWETPWFVRRPEIGEVIRDRVLSAARGETVRFEAPAATVSGAEIIVDLTFGPIRDADGKIVMVTGFGVDVTERVRALEVLNDLDSKKRALLNLARRLESATTVRDVVAAVDDELAPTLGYDRAWLLAATDDGRGLELVATAGAQRDGVASTSADTSPDRLPEEITGRSDVGVVEDLRAHERGARVPCPAEDGRTVVAVPISLASQRFCVVCLGTFGDRGVNVPSAVTVEHLAAVSSHLSAALDRIELAEARAVAEAAASRSLTRYQRLHDSMTDAFAEADLSGRIVDSNRAYREMLGYTAEELAELTYADLTPARWHLAEQRIVQEQVLPLGHSEVYRKEYRRRDGAVFPVEIRTFLLHDDTGVPTGMWAIVRDVSESTRTERELRESERRLKEAQAMAGIGSWELDLTSGALWWSDQTYRLFERDPGGPAPTYADFLALVHPEDRQHVDQAFSESVETRKPYHATHRIRLADGRVRFVEERAETIYADDHTALRSRGTVQDLTQRVEIEDALRRSLAERETLLREVHHRVKNNLQVISSVLYFQSKKLRDPNDLGVLDEARDRLRSMILVHQKLYQARDLSRVEFTEYLRALVGDLHASHASLARGVVFRVEGEPLPLPIEQALPLGMITCELATNAFKYAFPSQTPGTLGLAVRASVGRVEVSVVDDGVGLPPDLDEERGGGFGWQLVRNLVRQLDGDICIDRSHETAIRITCRASEEMP